jgi:hypothetical protein
MATHPTEQSIDRKIEDLTNELAYITSYPERFTHVERLVRKVAVISLIKELRIMRLYWACPIEQFPFSLEKFI